MPEKYLKRKSVRLHHDDYSTTGAYLVTVCTHKRECIFGRIKNEQVVFNEIGKLVRECWQEIPEHFRDLKLDACVVMPNHLHGIIIIQKAAGEPSRGPARGPSGSRKKALGAVVGFFKSSVTKRIRKSGLVRDKSIWQRGYYEHAVNNRADLENIRNYIVNNPVHWSNDSQFTGG